MAQRGGARPGAGRKPGKVGQAKRELAEMAKDHAEKALRTLIDIATGAEHPAAARVSAATAILDRGYGKPPQAMDVSNSDGSLKAQPPAVIQLVGVAAQHDDGAGQAPE